LQYILNEEGRARPVANDSTQHTTRFVYDYFIKDHLGNVRSTVTAQPINAAYLAGHEISMANVEQLIFDNIPNVRDGKPGTINPNDGMAAGLVAELADKRIGTAVLLKVMPGDRFTIDAQSYYEDEYTGTETIGNNDIISSLMSVLGGGSTYAGVPINELSENARTIKLIFEAPNLAEKLNTIVPSNYNAAAPKAHLNYLFFDDNLQLVADLSGKIQVSPNGAGTSGWQTVGTGTEICNCTAVAPGSSGYIAIYVDNQSLGKKVWFDDLHIEHYTSEVLEEDHYYPFGLTVQTLNNSTNITKNDIKFQSQKHDDDLGINIYSFKYREHDPTIGRFWQVDPLAAEYVHNSPYAFSENKVTGHVELEGLEAVGVLEGIEVVESMAPAAEAATSTAARSGTATLSFKPHESFVEMIERKQVENFSTIVNVAIQSAPAIGRFAEKTVAVAKELVKNYEEAHKTSEKAKGRGANRTPDPDAVGDHTVINENGTTTYTRNDNNPNKNNAGAGFETKKRVDYKGAGHVDKKTGKNTPTPHVQEGGNVRPAEPGKDMPSH
jgi:RHS repeat-associated protein